MLLEGAFESFGPLSDTYDPLFTEQGAQLDPLPDTVDHLLTEQGAQLAPLSVRKVY